MRLSISILFALVFLAGCGGGSSTSKTSTSTIAATTAGATNTPRSSITTVAGTPVARATPQDTRVAPGDAVEVTGVVGSISQGDRVIEITRLSGASVNRIIAEDSTSIRQAGGGRVTFGEIRTSDRIVASGTINDRGDGLVASAITVQAVVPGAVPGG